MQDKTVDKAFNDLMTAEHSLVNAQCVLAEHINDLQERIEELEAEIKRLREALEGAESETRRVEEIKDAHAESAWKVHAENTRLREFLGKLEAILRKALEENE